MTTFKKSLLKSRMTQAPGLMLILIISMSYFWSCTSQATTAQDKAVTTQVKSPLHKAYAQIENLSTAAVVIDLGNFFTKANSCNRETHYSLNELQGWALTIPCNVAVKRLIEEGRKEPKRVAALLRKNIANQLATFPELMQKRENHLQKYQRGEVPHPSIGEQGTYYAQHHKYKDPLFEFERVNYLIYSALYILVNIEQPDKVLLAEWIAQEKSPETRSTDLDFWLIHLYANSNTYETTQFAQQHNKIIQAAKLTIAYRLEAPWNAVIREKSADKPLYVFDIPVHLPVDTKVREQVIHNFMNFAMTPAG